MEKRITAYLVYDGYYDNGHEFIVLDPYGYLTSMTSFDTVNEASEHVRSMESEYKEFMENTISHYRKTRRVFNPENAKVKVWGYVEVEVYNEEKDQYEVEVQHHIFEHKWDSEIEVDEDEEDEEETYDFIEINLDEDEDDETYDYGEIVELMIEYDIATEDEINLVTGILGNTTEALNSIIFYRSGYRDIEQFLDEV